MAKKGAKDQRQRLRIKEQVLQIYEQQTFKQFEENDPNFNKIIVHIERVLKITTAQTLAIDSLERKILNLSKRNQNDENDNLMVPKRDEKIKQIIKQHQEDQDESLEVDDLVDKDKEEVKFADIFPDIQEDNFESSDDEEKRKNERLERLSKVAAPPKNIYSEINQNVAGEPPAKDNNQEENDNILIAENGDILARYRIPLSNN